MPGPQPGVLTASTTPTMFVVPPITMEHELSSSKPTSLSETALSLTHSTAGQGFEPQLPDPESGVLPVILSRNQSKLQNPFKPNQSTAQRRTSDLPSAALSGDPALRRVHFGHTYPVGSPTLWQHSRLHAGLANYMFSEAPFDLFTGNNALWTPGLRVQVTSYLCNALSSAGVSPSNKPAVRCTTYPLTYADANRHGLRCSGGGGN